MDAVRFLHLLSPVAEKQRHYVRAHPLAYWFSIGICITGILALVWPDAFEQTPASLALPEWLRDVFSIVWVVGGGASFFGIARGFRAAEAGGMGLLATGLVADYFTFIYLRPISALSGLFVLLLAIGCARRAIHLSRGMAELPSKAYPYEVYEAPIPSRADVGRPKE